jgi:flagellar basal body-associated protein FliL
MTDEPLELSVLFGNLDKFTDYLIPIGVFLTILMVVIGGYMWIASAGNPDKVKQAQGTLTWAIIGIVFIAIATLLINIVIKAIQNL